MNLNNYGSQRRMIPQLPLIDENLNLEKERGDYSTSCDDPSTPINIDQNDPSAIFFKEETHDLYGLDITTIVFNFDALVRRFFMEFEISEEGSHVN